jgi:hypothetical protein
MFSRIKSVIARFMDKPTQLPVDSEMKQVVQARIKNPLKFILESQAEPRVKNLAKRYANAGQGDKVRELAVEVQKQYGG